MLSVAKLAAATLRGVIFWKKLIPVSILHQKYRIFFEEINSTDFGAAAHQTSVV
jgi:hypothetical protein